MGRIEQLITELRRRRVFRALVVWGVVAFAILQVWEPVMHGLHLPDWTLSFVVVLLGLGFPITVALAWMFDLKPGGIERTPPAAEPEAARTGARSRAASAAILLGLGLAAAAPGLVYFFVWPGAGRRPAERADPGAEAPGGRSVAVLPFVNLSSDQEQEYFSDGIAEEILNALAQVDGLRVIGRTSSFAMKGTKEDLRTIGQRLGATTLLEGSVRKAGSRVRITAQLVESAGGSHLWSQAFDRELTDVFAVQDEIAHAVVAALKLKLLPPVGQEQRTVDPGAHDQYLLGLAFLARGSGDAYERAVVALDQAVKLDPNYAPAWAALARARFWAGDQSATGNPRVQWPLALAAAEKAVELAPARADGYFSRGAVRMSTLQDWAGARADLERARALSPGSPGILTQHASLLAALGQLPEAVASLKQAASLDPLSADIPAVLSTVYLGTGQLPLAEAAARSALELSPEHGRAARNLGFALLLQGRLPEAQAAFRRSSNTFFGAVGEVMVEHTMGHAEASQRTLQGVLATPYVRQGSFQVAQAYAWRGETDRAFEWLGHAIDEHDAGLNYLKYDPFLRRLAGDPRFPALLRRMKLPVH